MPRAWLLAVSVVAAGCHVPAASAREPGAGFAELRGEIPADVYPQVELIHRAPRLRSFDFDPAALIRAVNALWPLGRERALAALRVYCRVAAANDRRRERYDLDEQRVFAIVRLLFVPNDAQAWPVVGAGDPVGVRLADAAPWPLFPLALVQQIPFFLPIAYDVLGAGPQSPTEHLDFCAAHCRMRDAPLAPSASPVAAVEELTASPAWRTLAAVRSPLLGLDSQLRLQALRALTPSLPRDTLKHDPDAEWSRRRSELARRPIRWDARAQRFTVE